MKLSGQHLREVSFPVGGIGAGCIGLAGNGRLIDWEIFNRPNKNSTNGFSHFAIRVERDGKVIDARVLNGDQQKDIIGFGEHFPVGFGFGTRQESMAGFPHFRECEFDGEFPTAELTFRDPDFPGIARVRAWSPFVPGRSDLASLPCAVFEIEVENTTDAPLDYACGNVLCNPWADLGTVDRLEHDGALTRLVLRSGLPTDDIRFGEIAITTDAAETLSQEYLFRGGWMDRYEVYWHDWTLGGDLPPRTFPPRDESTHCPPDSGLLAGRLHLAPGAHDTVRFVISWFVPNCENYGSKNDESFQKHLASEGRANRWLNYYAAKLCTGAADAAAKIFADYDGIRGEVFLFRDALHRSTLPESAIQGAAANLAVLVSPTCLRLEDGTFWGWEGVATKGGSCHGTCQHVWNYAQALPLLFPDLERTIRESQAKYGFDARGAWTFRLPLPLGTTFSIGGFRPCVDGSFGEVMKMYREWKVSGDDAWLRTVWPAARKALEWAWSDQNPDRWDPEKSGVLTGRQHHTLDMEFFGPSAWLNGHYLGALKAASRMAPVCGDEAFGRECADIFERGRKACEEILFNGEYYIERVDLNDKSILDRFGAGDYWDAEHGEIKYQMGEGCAADALLAQWYATLYGLGDLFDPARVKSSLAATFRHNFIPSMRRHVNPWRIYMKDDEGGLVICSWPEGTRKPVIPVPYNTESFTGVEWAIASHFVLNGLVDEGATLAAAIRERYDGAKRNPWNEYECGSNYARSMASFGMLQAYSGFSYDMTEGRIGFHPAVDGDFRSFWSLGMVWGEYERKGAAQEIRILHGGTTLRSLDVAGTAVTLNGKPVAASRKDGRLVFDASVKLQAGDVLSV